MALLHVLDAGLGCSSEWRSVPKFLHHLILIGPLKILLLQLAPLLLMSDQLKHIQEMLSNAAFSYQSKLAGNSSTDRCTNTLLRTEGKRQLMNNENDIEDIEVIQYFMPSCRASALGNCMDLPAARLLRSLTDSDGARCRPDKDMKLSGTLLSALVALPAIFALIGEFQGELLFDLAFNICVGKRSTPGVFYHSLYFILWDVGFALFLFVDTFSR